MFPTLRRAFWILGVAVFLLIVFLPGYTKLQELKDKNRDLETKIKKYRIENSLLQEELKLTKDDPWYQEKIAREKLGVVRKGEVPIRIMPEREQ